MRNLLLFFYRNYIFFLFLGLEILSLSIFIHNNKFQKAGFLNTSNAVSASLLASWNTVTDYFSLQTVNVQLAEENARLRTLIPQSAHQPQFPAYLVSDTAFRRKYSYISAEVVNNTVSRRNNYITLDKGSANGIKKDMAVIGQHGVVGVVVDVSEHFSTAISMLHKDMKLSGKLKKNGQVGNATWEGFNYRYCSFNDIPSHVTINKDDSVVTSGYSAIFPEGIMIGTIQDYSFNLGEGFYSINLKYSTDFNNLNFVYVVVNNLGEEQQMIEKRLQQND